MKACVHSAMIETPFVLKRLFLMMTPSILTLIYAQDVPHVSISVRKMLEALLETHLKLKNLHLKKQTAKEKSPSSIYKLILFLATFLTYSFSSLFETSFRTFLLTIFLAAASRTLYEESFLTTSAK